MLVVYGKFMECVLNLIRSWGTDPKSHDKSSDALFWSHPEGEAEAAASVIGLFRGAKFAT
jgi:hypothetical protein